MAKFTIKLSPVADAQIVAMRADAESNPTGAQAMRWKAIQHVLQAFLPDHADDPSCRKKGDLPEIRGKHAGARDRVLWIASQEKQLAIVLMIGFVKDGDKNDAYVVLPKALKRGDFDAAFEEAGLPTPK